MNRRFLFILLILSLLLVSGCVSPQTPVPATAPAPALATVKVGYQPTSSNGPLYLAKEEGFFAEQGINLELVRVQSTALSLPSLVNGDLDATGGPVGVGIVNAVQGGAHVRIVADKGSVRPGYCTPIGLLVRKDLYDSGAVRNISDLKGLKILSLANKDYDLSRALAKGNLTYDDVNVVVMDYPSAVVAFKNGAIDAGILSEPFITQAVTSGSAVMLMPAQEYTPQYGIPLFYGPSILDRNPELGRKFMVGYLKGVRQYNEGKTPRNLAIISNYTGMNESLLNQSCWYPIAGDGIFPTRPVREYLDWMVADGKITQDMDENQLFDLSYVRYADGVLQNSANATGTT